MSLRLLISVLFMSFAVPASAFDPVPIAESTVAQWRAWMNKWGIKEGAIVVAYEGEVVLESGISRTVDDPAKVASLSKAITAVCALHAADAAGKDFKAPLAEVIPAALAAHPPANAAFADITIGQLITHKSGITSTYHRRELAKLKTFQKENKLWQFSKFVTEDLSGATGFREYAYSNANYLALGLVIEELSGEGYEEYCKREILDPLGITTAKLNDNWRVMTSWGGWEISARDYLTFAEATFKGENSVDKPGGFTLFSGSMSRGRSYGAGVIFRRAFPNPNIWHSGSWIGVKGRVTDPFGSQFGLYDNGFSIVTNFKHDAWDSEVRNELDALLYNATHP
ncbi:MAG: serine hydrolase [Pseudomonadota bacterium]